MDTRGDVQLRAACLNGGALSTQSPCWLQKTSTRGHQTGRSAVAPGDCVQLGLSMSKRRTWIIVAAVATLAAKIKAGGTGVWGEDIMPPQPQVSDADAKTLAEWILALPPGAPK